MNIVHMIGREGAVFKVRNLTLLLIAAAVWFAAGANIAHIGLEEYALGYVSVLNVALSIVVGIAIRSLHLLPDVFIAVFYTGLGTALALAGVLFAVNFFRVRGGAYPLEPAA